MQHPNYDDLIQFASEGEFEDELQQAKTEFVGRTGDLFESDSDFESRIASFLEWYSMDRMVSNVSNSTPAKLFIESVSPELTTPEIQGLRGLTRTILSLFEIKKMKGKSVNLLDILSSEKYQATTSAPLLGVEPGDIIESRLYSHGDAHFLSDIVHTQPSTVKKPILKAAKEFQKEGRDYTRIQMVQRVAFLRNRAVRYAHVDPKKIFSELSI